MNLLKKIVPVLLILLSFASCEGFQGIADTPEIMSFSIMAGSGNPVLSADINGAVEHIDEGGTITLTVPAGFDFSNTLTPTIGLSTGASVRPASGVAQDFSVSPLTYTVYLADGGQRVYNVLVKEAVAQATIGHVFISEVFNGEAASELKEARVDNAYFELYNRGSVDYDLSQFSLRFLNSETTDENDLDYMVPLTGTIAAGSTFVIYNQFIETSKLNTVSSIGTDDRTSDLYLNGITMLDGNDGIELLQNEQVIDLFSPAEGKDAFPRYSDMKKFIRKGSKGGSSTWGDYDWILYPVAGTSDDDDTAGGHSDAIDSEANYLTYFAFEENLENPVKADIDHTGGTVSILLPDGTDTSSLKAVFGTDGKTVTVNSRVQETAVSDNDFSAPVDYTVWAENGGTRNYTVSAMILESLDVTYTEENYDFDGNIQAVLDAIGSSSGDVNLTNVKGDAYAGAAGTVTGVVTAKGIYGHSTARNCFFLQDKDAGIYFFSNDGLESYIGMGTKVTIPVTTGKVYYGMPEVIAHGSASIVDQNVPIYYETGDYANASALGKVFLYEGAIESSMDGFSVGLFNGSLNFHSDRDFAASLEAGNTGRFYGPITYSYNLYRMEIISDFQIEL